MKSYLSVFCLLSLTFSLFLTFGIRQICQLITVDHIYVFLMFTGPLTLLTKRSDLCRKKKQNPP